MPALSRRALLATTGAGAAGVALAACGTEADDGSDRSAGADADLLERVAQAEAAVAAAAAGATTDGSAPAGEQALARAIAAASEQRLEALGRLDAEGFSPAGEPEDQPAGGSLQSLASSLEPAIAAYREAAALLSTEELRASAFESIAPVAAALAAVRSTLGEEPSPFAFVTGLDEPPYEDVESDSDETTSEETETTSTSTTSTSTAAPEEAG